MRPALLASLLLVAAISCGGSDDLLVGVATSVHDSGLADELVAAFEEANPDVDSVKPIPAGSGQLAELARRGEVDVIITHEPQVEADLIAEGAVSERRPFMHNFFLLVGPPGDPAAVEGAETLAEAFGRIAEAGATFVSRGDRSGTNVRELAVWEDSDVDPEGESWYQESGAGQGQSLLVASDRPPIRWSIAPPGAPSRTGRSSSSTSATWRRRTSTPSSRCAATR
jgi:tungstate transport system substrate-binding protein